MRGQGATNVIATTASEAKKGKGGTKEGFVAETLNIIHRLKSRVLLWNQLIHDRLKIFKSSRDLNLSPYLSVLDFLKYLFHEIDFQT